MSDRFYRQTDEAWAAENDLPGMWEAADLSGGWADATSSRHVTADPRVTLTEAEKALVTDFFTAAPPGHLGPWFDLLADLIAARLAPIRALADLLIEQGDEHVDGCEGQADCAACVHHDLMQALDAPQDAPRGPVGGEQGAEACWSCDGTGSLRGGQHDGEACPACTEEGKR